MHVCTYSYIAVYMQARIMFALMLYISVYVKFNFFNLHKLGSCMKDCVLMLNLLLSLVEVLEKRL